MNDEDVEATQFRNDSMKSGEKGHRNPPWRRKRLLTCMIPLTAAGRVQTQLSQLNLVHISVRLLIEPINATGNVQRMIRAAVME